MGRYAHAATGPVCLPAEIFAQLGRPASRRGIEEERPGLATGRKRGHVTDMAEKHPKSSRNPSAKSLGRWENEGGAPKHPKRPRAPLAKAIVHIATGEIDDGRGKAPRRPDGRKKGGAQRP